MIERLGITSLAGSPTAYRMLMAAGTEAAARLKGKLRVVSSAGEPLNPEVVRWFDAALGAPIYDHYGQTELGMVVNNHHGLAHVVHAGSAGFAMPGYRVAVLDDASRELGPGEPGNLAIDIARSPLLWFHGYWQQDTPAIAGGYYRTGDNVELEPDGTVSFIGRADDVITSSGYRIGPFDVESALIEHPAVSEAAVIGVPDAERTEIVKAFVVLSKDYDGTPALAEELSLHVKRRLSAHAYPRAIDFVDALPKPRAARSSASCCARWKPRRPLNPEHNLYGLRMDIKDRVFLITGAGSGLGAAVARMVVAEGGKAVLLDVNEEAGAGLAHELGAAARFVKTDVTSEADGQAAVAAARDAFGRIDALVNCAGVAPGERWSAARPAFARPFRAGGVDQSGRHVQHDSAGRRRDVEAGLNAEGERGVIVNTASVAAFDGQIGQAAYAASKSGVVGMTLPIARGSRGSAFAS